MDADQNQQQQEQHIETTAASPSSTPQPPTHSAASILDQLQRLSLELREQHGIACAILGKDGRVVALADEDAAEEHKEATEQGGEAGGGGASSQLSVGSLAGYEHTDIILKINGSTIKYLQASSGTRTVRFNERALYDKLQALIVPPSIHQQ